MTTAGIRLLSSLRATKSRSFLDAIPVDYFDGEERETFLFIKNFVASHNEWPTSGTVARETGLQLVLTREPLTYYVDQARERALFYALREPYKAITQAFKSQKPDKAIEIMRDCIMLDGQFHIERKGIVTLDDSFDMVAEDFTIAKRTPGLRGIPTGFPYLDEITEGLQPANLYTIVARTGIGKTVKLLLLALAAHRAGYSVLFLSMEMGVLQLARRFMGLALGIDPTFLRSGKLSTRIEREMRAQINQQRESEKPGFYWLAGNFKKSVPALKLAAQETGADLIIGDAAYLLKGSDRNKFNAKHEIIGDVMEGIADIATSLNRACAISVQFNRTAIRSGKGSDDDGEDGSNASMHNPVKHLALHKIANSDSIAHISSVVLGLAEGDPPFQRTRRFAGILKGREGEDGWYSYNYQFRPPNFSQIATHLDFRDRQHEAEAPDISYMDAEV
jgi:hypothetical protein